MKQEYLESVPLKAPNFADGAPKFVVMTDTSEVGAGAVLLQAQRVGGELMVVQFESKTFNPAQRNYLTSKKELLAILFAVRKLQPYLFG